MANHRPVLPEDLEDLLDFIQKGKLFALQDWLKAGKTLRAPDNAERGANVIRTAVTTGFHSIVEELLRAGGWSPTELADALDLARSHKRDDVADLILHYSTQSPSHGLPPRAQRCLAAAGIPIEKQAVLHALRTGALSGRTTLYGKYTHRDVCRWLGIDEFFPSTIIPEDKRPPFVENGLSYRANGLLRRAGIPAKKPAVRHALQTGALVPGKRPYNYGKQTHAELCRWVGVDASALPSL
ncbi:MAG: hypothetical protein ABSD29_06555 [Verrucomicrobiota bacterium]|jgi:hypothetical protein